MRKSRVQVPFPASFFIRSRCSDPGFLWLEALKNAKGFIRRSLGKRMIIRYSPELIFISDKNIEYGVHIAKVLADTVKPADSADKGEQDGNAEEL